MKQGGKLNGYVLIIAFLFIALLSSLVIAENITQSEINDTGSNTESLPQTLAHPIGKNIEQIDSCVTTIHYEEKKIFDMCTAEISTTDCQDPPENTTCTTEKKEVTYSCPNGTKLLPVTQETCETQAYTLFGTYKIHTADYACLYTEESQTITLVCDSRYDGNGNGICTSGESCIKYVYDGISLKQFERNSRDAFVVADGSYYLDTVQTEVSK